MAGKDKHDGRNASRVGQEILSVIARVERLEEEKASIAADIKEVFNEAKGRGFSVATIKQLIKDRKIDPIVRREREAVLQLYRAAIGMLDGTPLGEAARKHLTPEKEPPDKDDGQGGHGDMPDPEPEPEAAGTIGPEDLVKARAIGAQAARDGKRVVDNPYTANDPRRAAWDEGWCAESGTDGMEMPKAWRRKEAKKKPDGGDDNKGDGDKKPDGEGKSE